MSGEIPAAATPATVTDTLAADLRAEFATIRRAAGGRK